MSSEGTQPADLSSGLLDELTGIVSRAAEVVLRARAGTLMPQAKADLSPVTAADLACEELILGEVARLLPGVPIVSEEAAAAGFVAQGQKGGMFVLVDPVDGTRELVAGRDEFTVNLAVVGGGRPRLGIVAAPARGLLWRAREGGGAERMRLSPGAPASAAQDRVMLRPRPFPGGQGLIAAVSRSHADPATEDFLARLAPAERLVTGSAIKFCHVAEGLADIYPRLAPTREWDVAAGDAILSIAGGTVTGADGRPLAYGKSADFVIPAFIAYADQAAAFWRGLRG